MTSEINNGISLNSINWQAVENEKIICSERHRIYVWVLFRKISCSVGLTYALHAC
jgi:hypothetical protein